MLKRLILIKPRKICKQMFSQVELQEAWSSKHRETIHRDWTVYRFGCYKDNEVVESLRFVVICFGRGKGADGIYKIN